MKTWHPFCYGIVLGITKHACSGRELCFCVRYLLRLVIITFLEGVFRNSRILEFSISKLKDPGVFDLKTPGSWSFWFQNSRILEFLFQLEMLSLSNENIPSLLLWYRFEDNKVCLFRSRTLFLYTMLVATCNRHFSWSIFQKLQDPGVFDLRIPGSWSFQSQNSRILEFLS